MQTQDTALIPLRARDGSVRAYAIVDAADADWVNQWRWALNGDGYAYRSVTIDGRQHRRTVYLHRELLGLVRGDSLEGDHIDRNRLNDCRSNLRAIPKLANPQNVAGIPTGASIHRGVTWDKARGLWKAQVGINGKNVNLGRFAAERDAAEVARAARARLLPYAVD